MENEMDKDPSMSAAECIAAQKAANASSPLTEAANRVRQYRDDIAEVRLVAETRLNRAIGPVPAVPEGSSTGPLLEKLAPGCDLDDLNQSLDELGIEVKRLASELERLRNLTG